jgi:hypothetical protein
MASLVDTSLYLTTRELREAPVPFIRIPSSKPRLTGRFHAANVPDPLGLASYP